MKRIRIKYFNEEYPRLKKIEEGDRIDLRVDSVNKLIRNGGKVLDIQLLDHIEYKKGDIIRFGLGVAMELPDGYEAEITPRSSTFGNWGFIQTNSVGVIDSEYSGDLDEWLVEFIATRDGKVSRFDRVCQFRIVENQPEIEFDEVAVLGNENRGGHGSTGVE